MKPATTLKIEPTKWATPAEVIEKLDAIREDAATLKIKSINFVCELADGSIYSGSSRTDDIFRVGAALMSQAMKLLGFSRD